MYKAAVRWMITRNIEALNRGDHGPVLAMFAADATLTFPGRSTFSTEFRQPTPGREACPTHRGRDEIERFLQRYTAAGIQMAVEDILVNGAPWKARAAIRAHVWSPGPDGRDRYANRAVLAVQTRWGKIVSQEDYEDTERAAAFDALLDAEFRASAAPPAPAPTSV
ncbi:MAG: nuclear transport factor 2 family protein [Acidimicrobiales bacterium]